MKKCMNILIPSFVEYDMDKEEANDEAARTDSNVSSFSLSSLSLDREEEEERGDGEENEQSSFSGSFSIEMSFVEKIDAESSEN